MPGLFRELDVAGTEKRLSLIASLFLHMLGVALIPWLDVALSWRPAPLPNYKLITLDYRRPLPTVVSDRTLFEPDLDTEDRTQEDSDPPVDSEETPTKGEPEGRTGDPQPADEQNATSEGDAKPDQTAADASLEADDQNVAPEGDVNLEQTAADAPPEAADQNASPDGKANLEQTAREAPPEPPDPSPEQVAEQEVQLLLPELRNTDPSLRDIVLHPEFTAELPRSHELDIPPTLLWTPELSSLEPLTILEPTAEAPDTPVQDDLPAVQPQVRTPNEESRLSSLQIRQLTLENDNPALTVPPADVTPLAALEGAEDAQTVPSITGEEGLNSLVALSGRPDIESSLFDLLPGLRLGSIPTDIRPSPDEPLEASGSESGDNRESTPGEQSQPEGGGLDRGFDSEFLIGEGFTELGVESSSDGPRFPGSPDVGDDGGRDGLVTTVSESKGGAKIIDILASSGTGERRAKPALGEHDTGPAVGERDIGPGAGEREAGPGAGGDPSGEESASGLRPLPRSKYGIILVSNSRNSLPEAARVLTGTPVYTVHFDVPEAPRKWILQYCRPRSQTEPDEHEPAAGVIRVRTLKRVDPPYALARHPLRLDQSLDERPRGLPKRVVVYAQVTADGRLEHSRVVRGADPDTDQMILANLLSWNFLPAFQEGQPVSVEALFGIPLQ